MFVSRKILSFMDFVPSPGLFPDPGLASPEESLQALESGFAAIIARYKFFKSLFHYGIDGSLFLEGKPTGFFQEFVVDFHCDISHVASPICRVEFQPT